MRNSSASSNRATALAVSALALVTVSGAAMAGPDWIESGDAGSTVQTAQVPLRPDGAATLNTIAGTLDGGARAGGGDFEDLYIISISDPASFSLTLINADFNPQFFLFNITLAYQAYGLLANDDATGQSNIPALLPAATDATGVVITAPGDYLLAITGHGNNPFSVTGPIFNLAVPNEISGPDGPGGFNPLAGWSGGGEFGHYNFEIVGTDFPTSPTPGTAGAFAIGGMVMFRRRR